MLWGSAAEWTSAGAAVASAIATVAVAVIAWWQLGGIRDQVEATYKQALDANAQSREARAEAKIERTLTACSRYESDVVVERCVRRLRFAYEKDILDSEAARYKHDVIIVLNYLDSLAIGFEQDLYNEDLAKDHMSSIVKMYNERFLEKNRLKTFAIDPNDYHCLIKLASKWEAKAITFRAEETDPSEPTAKKLPQFARSR